MYRNLNAELARAGITRQELAREALHITPTTLSHKMNCDDGFLIKEAILIKKYLKTDISIDELFKFDDTTASKAN